MALIYLNEPFLIDSIIANREEWLQTPVVYFCSLFFGLDHAQDMHNSCLLLTGELSNKNILVT